MKEKWLCILVATALLSTFSGLCGTSDASVSSPEVVTEIEDFETEAVVIDAIEDREGGTENEVSENEELPRTPPGQARNGKQFLQYVPLLPEALLIPELVESENGMIGLPPVPKFDGTCVTNQGKRGNCEKFEKCYPLLNLPVDKSDNGTTNYNNLVDEVYDLSRSRKCSSVVHSGQSNYANVCCDIPSQTKEADLVAQYYDSQVAFDEGFTTNIPETPKYTKVVNTWATCGEKQFLNKIIGGEESLPHEYPWMVSLWGKSGKHICGASLLDNQYVLTAAHCIARYTANDIGKIRLFIGDHNIHSTNDGHHETRSVSRIIKHKRFSLQTFVNDIALLKLDRPVPYSDRIRPICLPSNGATVDSSDKLVVAGWGQTSYKGTSSSTLRKVLVPGVSNSQCENDYNGISPVGITSDMLCAGGRGVDSCIGDSGGPLIKLTSDRYEQIGIVSFGRECGTYPGVYTKVHSFLHWLEVNRKKY